MRAVWTLLLGGLLLLAGHSAGGSSGPSAGWLVLSGGELGAPAMRRFARLAGGADAAVLYIPSGASGVKLPSGVAWIPPEESNATHNTRGFEEELARLFGVAKVTLLHSRERRLWDSEPFTEPLRQAGGVWIGGGNAGRLADLLLDTRAQRELQALLDRGGVIGGNSAGAMIAGSFILRGRPDKPVLMAQGHDRGFGFIPGVAINPHLTSARREEELVNVLDAHPELLGIGLDDDAAVVIHRDELRVLGPGRVAIYDDQKHGAHWYYDLPADARFDLRLRR
jgi:cyanophycinase